MALAYRFCHAHNIHKLKHTGTESPLCQPLPPFCLLHQILLPTTTTTLLYNSAILANLNSFVKILSICLFFFFFSLLISFP